MTEEEEFKLLLARAELLVSEAKEILREAQVEVLRERWLLEGQEQLRRGHRNLRISMMMILLGGVVTALSIINMMMR